MRAAFFWAEANPFLRRMTTACSMSPFASTSAFLQSNIPTPVFSRSSLTCLALISISIGLSNRKIAADCTDHEQRIRVVREIRGSFLHHCGFVRRLDRLFISGHCLHSLRPSTFKWSDNVFALRLRFPFRRFGGRGGFFVNRLAFNDGLGNLRGEQADRAQRIVVAG